MGFNSVFKGLIFNVAVTGVDKPGFDFAATNFFTHAQ
jgi:hypothetical protein